MAIAKMKLITISAEKEHLLDVLQKFIDLDYFHPEPASKFIDSVHGLSSMDEEKSSAPAFRKSVPTWDWKHWKPLMCDAVTMICRGSAIISKRSIRSMRMQSA